MIKPEDITLGSKFISSSGSITEIVFVSSNKITGESFPSPGDTYVVGQSITGSYLGIDAAQQWANDFNINNYTKVG